MAYLRRQQHLPLRALPTPPQNKMPKRMSHFILGKPNGARLMSAPAGGPYLLRLGGISCLRGTTPLPPSAGSPVNLAEAFEKCDERDGYDRAIFSGPGAVVVLGTSMARSRADSTSFTSQLFASTGLHPKSGVAVEYSVLMLFLCHDRCDSRHSVCVQHL